MKQRCKIGGGPQNEVGQTESYCFRKRSHSERRTVHMRSAMNTLALLAYFTYHALLVVTAIPAVGKPKPLVLWHGLGPHTPSSREEQLADFSYA